MSDEGKIGFGSIQIDKLVLADIAASAVNDIAGASPVPFDVKDRLLMGFGNKRYPGISVAVDKENQVTIDVRIYVSYSMNIPDIARQVQDAIRAKVEQMADITLKDVNIVVQGIERGQK